MNGLGWWENVLVALLVSVGATVAAQSGTVTDFVENAVAAGYTVTVQVAEPEDWLTELGTVALELDADAGPNAVTFSLSGTSQESRGLLDAKWQQRTLVRLEYVATAERLELFQCEASAQEKAPLGKWRPADEPPRACANAPDALWLER